MRFLRLATAAVAVATLAAMTGSAAWADGYDYPYAPVYVPYSAGSYYCPSGNCYPGAYAPSYSTYYGPAACPGGNCATGGCAGGRCTTCPTGTCTSGTCPTGTCPTGTCPSGTCPSGRCLSGSCSSGTCPSGSCPSGACQYGNCSSTCPNGQCTTRYNRVRRAAPDDGTASDDSQFDPGVHVGPTPSFPAPRPIRLSSPRDNRYEDNQESPFYN
jgi:hypothetical protein